MKVIELFENTLDFGDKGLKTLAGLNLPEIVNGDFKAQGNQLTSLEYGPKEVKGNVFLAGNKLTSLDYCPYKIDKSLYLGFNKFTSLQGIHKHFKNGYVKGSITLADNPIRSHILGLLLIPKLRSVSKDGWETDDRKSDLFKALMIINKHLKSDRDVVDCQQELIEAGLKQYAQL